MRAQRAHDALDLLGRPRVVERAVARLDLVRVGHARLVLLDERRPLVERAHEQVAAELAQARRPASRSRRRAGSARAPAGRPGPESSPAVRRMIDTPVSASPAMIARSTGAAPRQRGSSDGWTLRIS